MRSAAPVVAFLALPAPEQCELLPGIPFDRGVRDFYTAFPQNPLWLACRGLVEYLVRDDRVPEDEWLESVGLPAQWEQGALSELYCFLAILTGQLLDWQNLFTRRALMAREEWRITRRLAAAAVEELGWSAETTRSDVEAVVDELGRRLRET